MSKYKYIYIECCRKPNIAKLIHNVKVDKSKWGHYDILYKIFKVMIGSKESVPFSSECNYNILFIELIQENKLWFNETCYVHDNKNAQSHTSLKILEN